jgi:surfeit locus 1 family protein
VNARAQRHSILMPGLVAIAGFLVLFTLGTWQLERKAWKEALIAVLTDRAAAAPVKLPVQAHWLNLSREYDEFRRVKFRAEFIHTQEAFVYTAGSALRPDISGPGYWMFTPARLADGSVVIVNRGFVPQEKLDTHLRAEGQILEAVEIVGALRWAEVRNWFTPNDDPGRNVWYVRDHIVIATVKHLGLVAPFYVDMEAPAPPGGLPQVGPLTVKLRNDHLQYAITWYGLAAVLAVVFVFWARGRSRAASHETLK